MGLGNANISSGVVRITEQMFDHHGFCELEIVDFTWFPHDSGAVERGHGGVKQKSASRCQVGEVYFFLGLGLWRH